MKTILVPTGGSKTDDAVFATALAAARALSAHLEFLHIHLSPGEAAAYTPHVEFARGAALRDALNHLEHEAAQRSLAAGRHWRRFCEEKGITVSDVPLRGDAVSAVWHEETGNAVERLVYRARRNDLVVFGRAAHPDGLPPDLIERVLVGCGRPILIAPREARQHLTRTALVCWKETPEAARALTAALPLLSRCKRVIVVCATEANASLTDAFAVAQQFAWHGVAAEASSVELNGGTAAEALQIAAGRYDADLMVMGAYGYSRTREIIFGGCTQSVIDQWERPVLLMH
jgi:nucleotide-binding universal stress UspA family protein